MGVLNVEDGVFIGLRFRELEIEIERLVVATHEIKDTAGIVADFFT